MAVTTIRVLSKRVIERIKLGSSPGGNRFQSAFSIISLILKGEGIVPSILRNTKDKIKLIWRKDREEKRERQSNLFSSSR
jgi:hypothetical protein